ncbi:MAG: S8 family serine peptidase [Chitinophagaceae bacterium]|nr:S8 family serine peptidase [Chitinophagaceae bacterium]
MLTGSSGIGRNIKGEGVTIGIGDDADPQHVDISGRKINHTHGYYEYHGTHVTGIAAGGGIWNELYTGHAPKARVVSQIMQGIINNSPAYVTDYDMVVTNNSWGLIAECGYMGQYDLYSAIADQQAFTLPNLQHVFAAGNSGGTTCSPYPASYKTVLNAFQSSKNVITVGNMFVDGNIAPGSSRGPVNDGRIKPEVVTQGRDVWSSANFVDYWRNSGTSMAAPAVSGGLALLYQRYRQLNASANPLNGLMKAIVCNSATDYGNPGPDFTYGFGVMNLLRSVETIESSRYFIDNITTGSAKTHDITVPANTAALKVMLYWNDPAASAVVAKALVNNLDLTVTTTSPAATYQPLILDPSPAYVTANAVQGTDTLNNIEQVTISNPAAGTYTVNVNGTAVPVGSPQQYFVAYDIIPVSTTLTHPVGGDKFLPGENVLLMWDSYGGNAETFTAEYSLDNSGSWVTISNSISSALRQYTWTVPAAAATNQALIRLTKNNTSQVSTSAVFTIIGAPALQLAPDAEQCEGYIKLNWTAVANATQYEAMKLRDDEMQSVAILPNSTLTYTFNGLSKDSLYWVTTRAIYNGSPGRRDTAVYRQPGTGSCTGNISDNDIKMESIQSPLLQEDCLHQQLCLPQYR